MALQSTMPPRFEIRPLEPRHLEWATAILAHSNVFHSPLWSVLHRATSTETAYAAYRGALYLVRHQIESGLSLGVFDTEYRFKRPETSSSSPAGGRLYWDFDDLSADGPTLLAQMDFPLVSIALAHDATDALDPAQMGGLMTALPAFAALNGTIEALDTRGPEERLPKGPGHRLRRDGTGTRHDFEGRGVMKNAAHHMMFKAAEGGFREVEIVCSSDRTSRVWLNPPEPFRAEALCRFDTATYEGGSEQGEKVNPFYPTQQEVVKIVTILA